MWLLEQIQIWVNHFHQYSQANPVVAGAISLWGLGSITYILRDIPKKIFNSFSYTFSTTVTINSYDGVVYLDFLTWLSENEFKIYSRSLTTDRYSNRKAKGHLSIGYGRSLFLYKNRPILMYRAKDDNNQTAQTKETITLRTVGRSHAFFAEMLEEVSKYIKVKNQGYTKIYTWEHNLWHLKTKEPRPLDTVIVNKKISKKLINHVDQFNRDKSWYKKHGIPYKTGILLYGPPGTGKTSLALALSTNYEKDLYVCNLSEMSSSSLKRALRNIPDEALILMEDIDTVACTNKRESAQNNQIQNTNNIITALAEGLEEDFTTGSSMDLGDILNILDGVESAEDRIIIATTNHPEKLDTALIREGRFDLKLKLDYLDDDTYCRFLKRFYPDLDTTGIRVKPRTPPCKLQQLIIDNKNDPKAVLKETAISQEGVDFTKENKTCT